VRFPPLLGYEAMDFQRRSVNAMARQDGWIPLRNTAFRPAQDRRSRRDPPYPIFQYQEKSGSSRNCVLPLKRRAILYGIPQQNTGSLPPATLEEGRDRRPTVERGWRYYDGNGAQRSGKPPRKKVKSWRNTCRASPLSYRLESPFAACDSLTPSEVPLAEQVVKTLWRLIDQF